MLTSDKQFELPITSAESQGPKTDPFTVFPASTIGGPLMNNQSLGSGDYSSFILSESSPQPEANQTAGANIDGITGVALDSDVSTRRGLNTTVPSFRGVVDQPLNVRSGPGTNNPIVSSLDQGASRNFDAVAQATNFWDPKEQRNENRWFRLQNTNNWVSAAFITGNPAFRATADTDVNIRNGPSISNQRVGYLPTGNGRNFDGVNVGTTIWDPKEGKNENRWFRLENTNNWVSAAFLTGEPNYSVPVNVNSSSSSELERQKQFNSLLSYQTSQFADNRPSGNIDMIIYHHTGGGDVAGAIVALNSQNLSSHYIVDRNGKIIQTVDPQKAARHAIDFNNYSIGIEIVNPNGNKNPYTEEQYRSLELLTEYLLKKYPSIKTLTGHEDVDRRTEFSTGKIDPGSLFDWERIKKAANLVPQPSGISRYVGKLPPNYPLRYDKP
jgi:N-acetyl-anhydromuramyl-L-alanine amidase AmpD